MVNIGTIDKSNFNLTPQNSSFTGGTIADISEVVQNENSFTTSYTITIKELRSFPGFESISNEEANIIIRTLNQLSELTFDIINYG